jgi:hypothetical protein
MTSHGLAARRPPSIMDISARARHWAIGAAAMPLLFGVLGTAYPAAPMDSGLAGCTTLALTPRVTAADWPAIGARFADSQWADLRFSGTAYVDLAMKLLSTHAYGGETVWFYERLAGTCAKHGRPLPFYG